MTGVLTVLLFIVGGMLTACDPIPTLMAGQVTDSGGGVVQGVAVRVYPVGGTTPIATATTDGGGNYSFDEQHLTAGTYQVRFGDADWYHGATTQVGATTVTVSADNPAEVNETYTEGSGTMSGMVTDGNNDGAGISGVGVQILDAVGTVVDSVTTSDGSWTSDDLTPGPYKVRFGDEGYGTVYSGGSANFAQASVINVSSGSSVSGVDATLTQDAEMTLNLDNEPDGANLYAIVVDQSTGRWVIFQQLEHGGEGGFGDGIYGLQPGTYRLAIIDFASVVENWVYGTDTGDLAQGTDVTLTAGQTIAIDPIIFKAKSCLQLAPHPNLSGMDLSGRSYFGCDLSGADLSGANLSGTNLKYANLTGANLSGAIIDQSTDLTRATIAGTNLSATDLSDFTNYESLRSGSITGTPSALPGNVELIDGYFIGDGVDLRSADLSGANLSGLRITNADFTDADLSGADLRGTVFNSDTLERTNLANTQLGSNGTSSTVFDYSILTEAVLDNATLDAGTSFRYTNLAGTSWANVSLAANGARLAGVTTGRISPGPTEMPTGWKFYNGYFVGPGLSLNGADLSGIDLHGVNLTGTTMYFVNLTGADLSGLDLSGRTIDYSNLTNANLSNVTVSSSTQFTGDRFTGTAMTGTNLSPLPASSFYSVVSGGITAAPTTVPSGWSLVNGYFVGTYANLDGADFTNVDLTNVNFSTTSVEGAAFAGATMNGVASSDVRGTPASLPTGWFIADSHSNGQRYLAGPYADLTNAVFSGINLTGADLHGANLTNASLIYSTNITGTNFTGATMSGLRSEVTGTPASLPTDWVIRSDTSGTEHLLGPGAYVYGAYGPIDFTGANLSGLNLSGVRFYATYLANANFAGSNLTGATFPYATLGGASFANADLTNASFVYATGTPTGGSTATYSITWCPDQVKVTSPDTCIGHGFGS